jgi:hypothetical protein
VSGPSPSWARPRTNRRAVLRGLLGVSVGLPFLESLPQRSAWAAGQKPVFSLFICAVEGVVPASFLPDELGVFDSAKLAAAGKATSELARHADRLLFVKNVDWAQTSFNGEPHAESLCMAFTARPSAGSGSQATSSGPSADWVIADKVQPGKPPLTLYAGNRNNGYIAERLSFSEAGQVTKANDNPYKLYQELIGLVGPDGTMTPENEAAARLLAESRKSVHDLVRDEMKTLMGSSRLSASDRERLQHHFDAIRDTEIKMDDMSDELVCTADGLETDKITALENFKYDKNGQLEDIVRLHMSLVAMAFACNYNRTATLQWGDGLDKTDYQVPSNLDRQWPFSYISHRLQSDAQIGDDPLAAQAHAEIDVLRMKTLAAGLDHFEARGLADQSFVLWVNVFSDGPSHSFRNVPHIVFGNGGGYLKQGGYVDAGTVANNQILNALISSAIQDTGSTMEDFGEGTPGQLTVVRA